MSKASRTLLGARGAPDSRAQVGLRPSTNRARHWTAFTPKQLGRVTRAAVLLALFSMAPHTSAVQEVWGQLRASLGKQELKKNILIAAPSIALVFVAGDAGGPAYHQVCLRVDQGASSPGSGTWKGCMASWRHRVDGATPTTRVSCYNPINGKVQYLDADQHGMNANFLQIDVGTGTFECEVTNDAGESSGWVPASISINTTARDSAKQAFVDGSRPDDTGDGLSWATAKKYYQTGYLVALSLGNGATLNYRSCDLTGNATTASVSNLLILADGSATVTATGNYRMALTGSTTNGLIFYGSGYLSPSVAGNAFVCVCANVSNNNNIGLYGIRYGNISRVVSISGDGDVNGLTYANVNSTTGSVNGALFGNNCESLLVFGHRDVFGGTNEHTFRLGGGGEVGLNNSYHSFQYSLIGNNVSTGKACIRWYASNNLWCFGCDLRRWCLVGFVSPDGNATGGDTWAFDCCLFSELERYTGNRDLQIQSGWTDGAIRNCVFKGIRVTFVPRDSETVNDFIENIDVLCCTFIADRTTYVALRWDVSLTNVPVNCLVAGCQFINGAAMDSAQAFIETKGNTGVTLRYNNFDRANNTDYILSRLDGTPVHYGYTAYAALGFVTGDTRTPGSAHWLTVEPTAGLTNVTAATPWPHFDYFFQERYDYTTTPYPAGAWRDSAIETVEYFTSSGNWVCPTGITNPRVWLVGGGGAGGSRAASSSGGAGGGGGGEMVFATPTTVPTTSYAISPGAGGTAASGDTAGGNGSDSTFASTTAVAKGGSGGGGGVSGTSGAGGTGGTGLFTGSGGSGGVGGTTSQGGGGGGSGGTWYTVGCNGGNGGSSAGRAGITGQGGMGGAGGLSSAGIAGSIPGGGGGGASRTSGSAALGGDGARGEVVIVYTTGDGEDPTPPPAFTYLPLVTNSGGVLILKIG